jgi:hypothetical protein
MISNKLKPAILGLALAGGVAQAGFKLNYPVSINLTSRYAQGSLGSTRNSIDTVQYIECAFDIWPASKAAYCYVRDTASRNANCYTTDPTLVAAVQELDDDGWLLFRWDASWNCTNISGGVGSQYMPRAP